MLQYRWMQLMGEAADTLRKLHQILLDSIASHVKLAVFGRYSFPQIAGRDAHGCDLLAKVVMKLACKSRPLLFLRVDEYRAQGANLLLGSGPFLQFQGEHCIGCLQSLLGLLTLGYVLTGPHQFNGLSLMVRD